MASEETKGLLKLQYGRVLNALKIEKLERPETYAGAASIVEELRQSCIDFTGADDFPPVPKGGTTIKEK